jgi:hypothetical protein
LWNFAQQLVQGQHYVAIFNNKSDVVYIGMCDWDEVVHLQEVMTSLYGFTKEQDATNEKKSVLMGCPRIFFCI